MPRKMRFVTAAVLGSGLICLMPVMAQQPAGNAPSTTGTEFGFQTFQQHCSRCHGNSAVKAPSPAALRQLAPEKIVEALTTGVMRIQGQALSEVDRRRVAEALSARPLGSLS